MSIKGVFYNGLPLEEVFKVKEVREQTTSIIDEVVTKTSNYYKPRARYKPLVEKSGEVKRMQKEINKRNMEQLVLDHWIATRKAEAVLAALLGLNDGSYQTSDSVGAAISDILSRHKVEVVTKPDRVVRNIVGHLKRSMLSEYFIYYKGDYARKIGNSFKLTEDGYNLKFEEAVILYCQPLSSAKDINDGGNIAKREDNANKEDATISISGEERVVRLGQDGISGITLVFNGPVTINITTK